MDTNNEAIYDTVPQVRAHSFLPLRHPVPTAFMLPFLFMLLPAIFLGP